MTALRTMATKALVTAATVVTAALGLGVAAAGPASAATFPGPAYIPGGDVVAQIDGTTGNAAWVSLDPLHSNQMIDDPNDSSTWGTGARTAAWNSAANSQRIYFHRVDTRQLTYQTVSVSGAATTGSISAGAYKILHYTADGHVQCLDADGSHGAPGAGAVVTWFGCDPNAVNQPNQLWAFGPVAGRPDDTWFTQAALVNLGSLPNPQNMDIRTAPILTAAANPSGTDSPLTLQAQANATAANSAWALTNANPVPSGTSAGCIFYTC